MRALACFLLLLCSTGCDLPLTKAPIGTPWQAREVSKLDATWVLEAMGMTVTLVGQKEGRALAGMIESKINPADPSTNSLKLLRIDCAFTRVGKHEMIFFKGIQEEKDKADTDEDNDPEGYMFWLVTAREANAVKLALPTEAFKKLVETGKLKGEIKKVKDREYPLIDADEKTFLAAIESLGIEKCFDFKRVETARRVVPKKP